MPFSASRPISSGRPAHLQRVSSAWDSNGEGTRSLTTNAVGIPRQAGRGADGRRVVGRLGRALAGRAAVTEESSALPRRVISSPNLETLVRTGAQRHRALTPSPRNLETSKLRPTRPGTGSAVLVAFPPKRDGRAFAEWSVRRRGRIASASRRRHRSSKRPDESDRADASIRARPGGVRTAR
jgi:hypothetical protein